MLVGSLGAVFGSVLVSRFRCCKGGCCFGWVLFWLAHLVADFREIAIGSYFSKGRCLVIRLDLWCCFGCCKGGARLVLFWLQSDTSVLERRTLTMSLKMKLQFSCVFVSVF